MRGKPATDREWVLVGLNWDLTRKVEFWRSWSAYATGVAFAGVVTELVRWLHG